jgi:S1-C subfamily serine protease
VASKIGSRPAAKVELIERDSAADKAGLQVGDLILSLGGDPVNDLPHFAAAIANQSGDTEMKILRDGQEQTLTVDLQPR